MGKPRCAPSSSLPTHQASHRAEPSRRWHPLLRIPFEPRATSLEELSGPSPRARPPLHQQPPSSQPGTRHMPPWLCTRGACTLGDGAPTSCTTPAENRQRWGIAPAPSLLGKSKARHPARAPGGHQASAPHDHKAIPAYVVVVGNQPPKLSMAVYNKKKKQNPKPHRFYLLHPVDLRAGPGWPAQHPRGIPPQPRASPGRERFPSLLWGFFGFFFYSFSIHFVYWVSSLLPSAPQRARGRLPSCVSPLASSLTHIQRSARSSKLSWFFLNHPCCSEHPCLARLPAHHPNIGVPGKPQATSSALPSPRQS